MSDDLDSIAREVPARKYVEDAVSRLGVGRYVDARAAARWVARGQALGALLERVGWVLGQLLLHVGPDTRRHASPAEGERGRPAKAEPRNPKAS